MWQVVGGSLNRAYMLRSVQEATHPLSESLANLERQRAALLREISRLGDFRAGSITGTGGRCGNPRCHCHHPHDPGHEPHPRLTYKIHGLSSRVRVKANTAPPERWYAFRRTTSSGRSG